MIGQENNNAESAPLQMLVTGFGPFGNVVSNPTERLIQRLRMTGAPGYTLTLCVLPVSYARAPLMLESLLEVGGEAGKPFDAVLMLGVAVGSACWRVEKYGRNHDDPRPDVDGYMPGGVIRPGSAELLTSTLPDAEIIRAIAKTGLPVSASDSAGGYLCNHALFCALLWLHEHRHPARSGFLHVPADEFTLNSSVSSATCFPFADHVRVLNAALQAIRQTGKQEEREK